MSNDFFSLDDYNQDRRAAMTQCPDAPAIAQPAQPAEPPQEFEAVYAAALKASKPGTIKDIARLCYETKAAQPVQPAAPVTLMQGLNFFTEQERTELWKAFNYSDSTIAIVTRAVLTKLAAQPVQPKEKS